MNINRVDLNLLGVFQAIMDTRSVTLAAEQFSITQPAMSNALGRLRDVFGDPLFVNVGGRMRPTPFAEEIAPGIQHALHEIQMALVHRKTFDPLSSDRVFRFHMTDMGQINFLPPLLERLHRIAPGVRVEAEALPADAVRDALLEDRIDFAIGHLPRLGGKGLRQRALVREWYEVVAREGHPLGRAGLTLPAFLAASHAVVKTGGHQVEEALNRHRARIHLKVPNFMVISMILPRTDMLVTVPNRLARRFADAGGFEVYALPIEIPPFQVSLFWGERFDADPAMSWMRDQIIDLFAEAEAA